MWKHINKKHTLIKKRKTTLGVHELSILILLFYSILKAFWKFSGNLNPKPYLTVYPQPLDTVVISRVVHSNAITKGHVMSSQPWPPPYGVTMPRSAHTFILLAWYLQASKFETCAIILISWTDDVIWLRNILPGLNLKTGVDLRKLLKVWVKKYV